MKLEAGKFYGQTAQTLAAGHFRFTEKAYKPDLNIPKHSHELAHFCFVLTGQYSEQVGRQAYERNPLALVYYPPDVSHTEKHFSNGRHFLVEIDFPGLEEVRAYGVALNEPVILNGDAALFLATSMYREFSERDRFSKLALESITTELLIAASRQHKKTSETKPPHWLRRVIEYLHENYSNSLGLNELAAVAGVHPTHLARVFRQYEKCTTGEYIRRIRIEKARQRMIESDQTLVEIALDTGFSDQAHFTRTFKRLNGMTPTRFLQTVKNC